MLFLLGENGSKSVRIVKYYGNSKNTTVFSAIAFLVRKGPLAGEIQKGDGRKGTGQKMS